jgi:hypothetical protein
VRSWRFLTQRSQRPTGPPTPVRDGKTHRSSGDAATAPRVLAELQSQRRACRVLALDHRPEATVLRVGRGLLDMRFRVNLDFYEWPVKSTGRRRSIWRRRASCPTGGRWERRDDDAETPTVAAKRHTRRQLVVRFSR